MNFTRGEAEEFIQGLEQDAAEIESLMSEFFSSLSREIARRDVGGTPNFHWETPEGQTKAYQRKAKEKYEIWHTAVEPLVDEYLPSRREEYNNGYSVVVDHLLLKNSANKGVQSTFDTVINHFDHQRHLLKSIPTKVEVERLRAKKQISTRVTRDEIQKSREMFEEDHIRAAGVISSVALERHLLTLCDQSDDVTNFQSNHGIARLAQTLYENEEITKTEWNDLKALASIRETCAHPEEPKKEAVRRLINDAEEFIRDL